MTFDLIFLFFPSPANLEVRVGRTARSQLRLCPCCFIKQDP